MEIKKTKNKKEEEKKADIFNIISFNLQDQKQLYHIQCTQ